MAFDLPSMFCKRMLAVELASQVDQRRHVVDEEDPAAVVARIVGDLDFQVPGGGIFDS